LIRDRILIDAIYLNSLGGLNLFKVFLNGIKNKSKYFVIVDDRFDLKQLKNVDYKVVSKNEVSRLIFYFFNRKKFSKIICFSNIPPPINATKTFIYFQNHLLINKKGIRIPSKEKLLLELKLSYIKFLNKKNYNWIVQTHSIKVEIQEKLHLKINNLYVFPFFKEIKQQKSKSNENIFIYPANFLPHKNHEILLSSFILAANKISSTIEIKLTIEESKFYFLLNKFTFIPPNLTITNLGQLNQDKMYKEYKKCKFLIFPSLKESFGLPLIEATNIGLKVLASNLSYVNEVVIPSLTFDPSSSNSICKVIIESTYMDLPPSKLKIKNRLLELITKIENV